MASEPSTSRRGECKNVVNVVNMFYFTCNRSLKSVKLPQIKLLKQTGPSQIVEACMQVGTDIVQWKCDVVWSSDK